jgi:hypothetical protein
MSAKDIVVKPISRADADRIVKSCHYSGKVVQNSQLHFGVFLNGKCGGAMQFGPSLDKRKIQGLVECTGWNNFIELNRMAFSDWLPRNSESRAISVAMKLIRKSYPHIEWVVSFADGTQCGDGTIYRASGFFLTGIRENQTLYELPDGYRFAAPSVTGLGPNGGERVRQEIKRRTGILVGETGEASIAPLLKAGAKPIPGFQLRYIYFLNPAARSRLTVPILPFSEINRRGAGMYLGKPKRASSETIDTPGIHPGKGGETPTDALHFPKP